MKKHRKQFEDNMPVDIAPPIGTPEHAAYRKIMGVPNNGDFARGDRAKKVTFIPEGATAQEAWALIREHHGMGNADTELINGGMEIVKNYKVKGDR